MLNQETQVKNSPIHQPITNNNNHNPLNDHNYCSPNKRLTTTTTSSDSQQQPSSQNQLESPNKAATPTSNSYDNVDHMKDPKSLAQSTNLTSSKQDLIASTSSSPTPTTKHEPPSSCGKVSESHFNKDFSNDDNLSESSLSSSVASSNEELIISQDPASKSLAPKNTPSVPRRKPRHDSIASGTTKAMNDCTELVTGIVRAKRVRQTTSVTDKSQWIMGDDQIDSILSEHLADEPKEKILKAYKEHDSAYDQFTSSDYSSSDAESNQGSECNSEDDPDRLWCVCQKPHDGKFMIRCDICMDWFHGHCVGVTKLMGDRFEKQGKEWFCSECKDKLAAGEPRSSIPKKRIKKERKKKKRKFQQQQQPIPGKRGRGRPRKSETLAREGSTRLSQRTTRKSSSSLDLKLSVDNGRLRRNLARPDARSESFDEFEDSQRLKELIKERKKEFFYKRHLAEQQKAAKRTELGLGRHSLTANLSDSLDSLATSTNAPNMNNLPINIKSAVKDKPKSKPNIVLQINTKKDASIDQKNPTSRIVTTIVRSPKKTKQIESIDPIVNDIFTAEPIQINKKMKVQATTSPVASSNQASGDSSSSSNHDNNSRKRSDSVSSSLKTDKSLGEYGESATPKKKRKDSESSTPNGSTTPIGSKHIAQKIKEGLEARSKQIKDIEVSSEKIEQLATDIEDQLNECFKEGTQKYLNKFRSLLFNLKDPKNHSLVKNVLTGEILPSRLVRMSSDEMASHELAKWRERENKHSIELIKRDAQLAAQQVIVKKTHKGEEVISAPSFNEPDDPSAEVDNQEPPTTPNKQAAKETRVENTTVVLTPPPVIGVVNTSSPGPLKMKITGISSVSSTTIEPEPSVSSSQCWSGSITMPEIAKFSAKATAVSGTVDFMNEEVNQNLVVCGRIAPDQVQGYIKKLKTTTKNQILVIQLFPLTEDDKSNFDVFFEYLYSRNRYGVIQTSHEILKDFYILPIHENSSIPEILRPIKGPGIVRKEPNCLLGLLVRSKRITPSSSTYTPTPIK